MIAYAFFLKLRHNFPFKEPLKKFSWTTIIKLFLDQSEQLFTSCSFTYYLESWTACGKIDSKNVEKQSRNVKLPRFPKGEKVDL